MVTKIVYSLINLERERGREREREMDTKGIEKLIKHVEDYTYVESNDFAIRYTTLDDIAYSSTVHIETEDDYEDNTV